MKRAIIPVILTISLTITGCTKPKYVVQAGGKSYNVETAVTKAERNYGLMNRAEMAADAGMLFIFPRSDVYGFWMKNTLIPLDIIWISENKKVVDVTTLQPCVTEKCESYVPKKAAKYVLELNAGEFQGKIGDEIIVPKNLPIAVK